MSHTDPIADMLTRIRNAAAVGKDSIEVPHSKSKESVAKILAENGFLASTATSARSGRPILTLQLSTEGSSSRITEISRLSRPGRRLYAGYNDIPIIKRGRGIVVVSTPAGMMTGQQAKSKNLGGELICKVY